MSRHYNHLSAEERAVVQIEIQYGKSMRSIARRLGRSPSTLSREVARQGAGRYSATEAGGTIVHADYALFVTVGRSRAVSALSSSVITMVLYRPPPRQIAAKLRNMHPNDSSQRFNLLAQFNVVVRSGLP